MICNRHGVRGGAATGVLVGCGVLLLIALLVAAVAGIWYVSTRNGLVAQQEDVKGAWGQVENVYQRRADLVPNLVKTIKGYAKHEKDVFTAVTEARAKVGQITVNPSDAASVAAYGKAQGELSSALSRLMAVSENYPQLKADGLFKDLMAQLEGTENRITVERKRWNDKVQVFNTAIRQWPTSMVAGGMGLTPFAYFEAEEGAEKAPQVDFNE